MKFLDTLLQKSNYHVDDNWHEDFIVHLAQLLKPEVYVELGIYRASLFNKMIPIAKECYAVDYDPGCKQYITSSPNAHFYQMTTREFTYILKDLPMIDILFIDADHDPASVINDFYNHIGHVKDNGLVFIHDTYPRDVEMTGPEYCGNAFKAIGPIRSCPGVELMTIPLHPGLTVVRKCRKQVPWE
jgi:hypothetical protein